MHAHSRADHDDFGGLQRDLGATAMRVSRRHIMRDGYQLELATVTGSVATGFAAALTVAIQFLNGRREPARRRRTIC